MKNTQAPPAVTVELSSFFSEAERKRLASAAVGIAGAGGLGSQAAIMLARSGIGALVLVDGDHVTASNLNRQHYFPRHVGKPKVHALAEQLKEIQPAITLMIHQEWIHQGNMNDILGKADIWIEALDDPASKALFSARAVRLGKLVVCASGMGGFGGRAMKRRILQGGRLVVTGDFTADVAECPPLAPRVIQCAAMQADAVLEYILTGTIKPLL